MAKRKTWREKLADSKDLPKIVTVDGSKRQGWGEGTYVVPAPIEVDEVMKKVGKGKLITINDIRQILAEKHGADFGCQITAGIFAWIAAHAAEEDADSGKKRITPYWCTLKTNGELNPKYPGGIENVKYRLESEGHSVVRKRKRFFVAEFEKSLVKPSRILAKLSSKATAVR